MCVCVMAVMLGSSLSCGDKGCSDSVTREFKRKKKKEEKE